MIHHRYETVSCVNCGDQVALGQLKPHVILELTRTMDSKIDCKICSFSGIPKQFFNHLSIEHKYAKNRITRIVVKRHLKQYEMLYHKQAMHLIKYLIDCQRPGERLGYQVY